MPETVTADFTTAGLPFTGTLVFEGASIVGIELINADGTNPRVLTTIDYTVPERHITPAWSPTGDRVAFTWLEGGRECSYLCHQLRRDQSGTPFSLRGIGDYEPAWSPDGQRIAFVHRTDTLVWNDEIYVMNADGTNRVPVASLRQPSIAPDLVPRWRENRLFELWQYAGLRHLRGGSGRSQLVDLVERFG